MSPYRPFRLVPRTSLAPGVAALAIVAFALAAAAPLRAQEENRTVIDVEDAEPASQTVEMKRISLPARDAGAGQPYTILVPLGWQARPDIEAPGVFVGPATGDLSDVPEAILVRESEVDLSDPEEVLGNLKAHAAAGDWTLLDGEVRDFGGTSGLWIVRRLPAGGLFGERINAVVKLPLESGSLDLVATVPAEDYTGVTRLTIEYVLGSVRPAAPDAQPEE